MTESHLYNIKKDREGSFPQLVMTISDSLMALRNQIKEQLPFSRGEQMPHQAHLERLESYFHKNILGFERDVMRLPEALQKERAYVLLHVQNNINHAMGQLRQNDQLTVEAKFAILEGLLFKFETLVNSIPENGQVVETHVKAGQALLAEINAARDGLTQEPATVLKQLDSALLVARADIQNELIQSKGPHLPRPER